MRCENRSSRPAETYSHSFTSRQRVLLEKSEPWLIGSCYLSSAIECLEHNFTLPPEPLECPQAKTFFPSVARIVGCSCVCRRAWRVSRAPAPLAQQSFRLLAPLITVPAPPALPYKLHRPRSPPQPRPLTTQVPPDLTPRLRRQGLLATKSSHPPPGTNPLQESRSHPAHPTNLHLPRPPLRVHPIQPLHHIHTVGERLLRLKLTPQPERSLHRTMLLAWKIVPSRSTRSSLLQSQLILETPRFPLTPRRTILPLIKIQNLIRSWRSSQLPSRIRGTKKGIICPPAAFLASENREHISKRILQLLQKSCLLLKKTFRTWILPSPWRP